MNDNSKTGRRYDYHFVVSVPLWVTDDGEITEVGDVQLEDNPWACGDMEVWMPEWEDRFPMRGDGWMRVSPADHDDQDIPVAFGKGWSAAMAAVNELLLEQCPKCVSCGKPIAALVHVAGADPCCAQCWHDDCRFYGRSCTQCKAFRVDADGFEINNKEGE